MRAVRSVIAFAQLAGALTIPQYTLTHLAGLRPASTEPAPPPPPPAA